MKRAQRELKREVGALAATALVAGEVIAVGIFLTPAGMAKSLGSPLWLLVVWLLMGLMALSGALCYGELAARFPQAGGSYVYLRESFGAMAAFLYGWMVLLVLDPGLTAALAVGAASYAGYILNLSPFGIKLFAVLSIVMLALANIVVDRREQSPAGFSGHGCCRARRAGLLSGFSQASAAHCRSSARRFLNFGYQERQKLYDMDSHYCI